ncbi:MAG: ABC-type transport auxiliary lipoprotein family protein [Rhodobacteraceae bacterium]|nr:ABC-type transport auxiliary lipoprotein family protein [Paracoccaceae bacterium]
MAVTQAALVRTIAMILALSALTGCGAISALTNAATPLEVFELRPPDTIPAARGQLARDLIIEVPTTSGALDTDRIMIRPNPLQAQYLPGVRWSGQLPVMVQTLLLRSIEETDGLRYVGRRPLGARGDYALVTEIVDFQAEAVPGGDGATIDIRLIARIVRESDAQILASRTFAASAATTTTATDSLIVAFDAATDQILPDFAAWVLSVVRR